MELGLKATELLPLLVRVLVRVTDRLSLRLALMLMLLDTPAEREVVRVGEPLLVLLPVLEAVIELVCVMVLD